MTLVKLSVCPLASLLFLSVALSDAQAADLVLTGAAGPTGAAGSTGQPGQNGGAAPLLGVTLAPANDASVTLTLYGGSGGTGGKGAAAVGGIEPTRGGNGGNGAAAIGQASAAPLVGGAYASSNVQGGAGGMGGLAGDEGMTPGCDGWWVEACIANSGAGGHGGDASAASTAVVSGNSLATATASALGGDGNYGNGRGVDAGRGGAATASAYGQSDSGNVRVEAGVQGGNGGGSFGGQAGNGASVTLENAAAGQTRGVLTLTQTAGGGSGGNAFPGNSAGTGGNASTRLTLSDATASALSANLRSVGGTGGTHHHDYGSYATVYRGGDATSELVLDSSRVGVIVSGNIEAYAGNSADATATGMLSGQATVYGNVTAHGGQGQSGSLSGTPTDGGAATALLSVSSPNGLVEASALAHGGSGGSGYYAGYGGVGGSASSTLTLQGAGAKGSSVALSGDSISNLTLPIASSRVSAVTSGALNVEVGSTAQGGSGSAAFATTTVIAGGGAGDAQASVTGTAEAYGGNAYYSRGGDATASLSLAGSGVIDGSALAVGGHGVGDLYFGGGGNGGTASSSATGITSGNHDVTLRAEAVGGNSFPAGSAGGASAQAYGQSGTGAVTLTARASGGTSTNGGASVTLHNAVSGQTNGALSLTQQAYGGDSNTYAAGGNASSVLELVNATASSLNGRSDARGGSADASLGVPGGDAHSVISLTSSRAGAAVSAGASAEGHAAFSSATAAGVGHGGILADARGRGVDGTVSAVSQAAAISGAGSARGTAVAYLGQDFASAHSISSAGYGGAGLQTPVLDGSLQVFSHVQGAPEAATTAFVLAESPALAAALRGPVDGRLFGSGVQGATYAPDGGGQALRYVSTGEFQFELVAGSQLVLGLLGASATGAGFDLLDLSISSNGVALFSQSFTSLSEAQLFFDHRVLDLGVFGGGLQDLVISSALTASSNGGFAFSYAFGSSVTAVPEAPGWLMMALGLMLLTLSRRCCAMRWR